MHVLLLLLAVCGVACSTCQVALQAALAALGVRRVRSLGVWLLVLRFLLLLPQVRVDVLLALAPLLPLILPNLLLRAPKG